MVERIKAVLLDELGASFCRLRKVKLLLALSPRWRCCYRHMMKVHGGATEMIFRSPNMYIYKLLQSSRWQVNGVNTCNAPTGREWAISRPYPQWINSSPPTVLPVLRLEPVGHLWDCSHLGRVVSCHSILVVLGTEKPSWTIHTETIQGILGQQAGKTWTFVLRRLNIEISNMLYHVVKCWF